MNLARLSHTKLSMIASALAVGDVFCCGHNPDDRGDINRKTVTPSHQEQETLHEFAYESMGCGHLKCGGLSLPVRIEDALRELPAGASDDERSQYCSKQHALHYFKRFMESV